MNSTPTVGGGWFCERLFFREGRKVLWPSDSQ